MIWQLILYGGRHQALNTFVMILLIPLSGFQARENVSKSEDYWNTWSWTWPFGNQWHNSRRFDSQRSLWIHKIRKPTIIKQCLFSQSLLAPQGALYLASKRDTIKSVFSHQTSSEAPLIIRGTPFYQRQPFLSEAPLLIRGTPSHQRHPFSQSRSGVQVPWTSPSSISPQKISNGWCSNHQHGLGVLYLDSPTWRFIRPTISSGVH